MELRQTSLSVGLAAVAVLTTASWNATLPVAAASLPDPGLVGFRKTGEGPQVARRAWGGEVPARVRDRKGVGASWRTPAGVQIVIGTYRMRKSPQARRVVSRWGRHQRPGGFADVSFTRVRPRGVTTAYTVGKGVTVMSVRGLAGQSRVAAAVDLAAGLAARQEAVLDRTPWQRTLAGLRRDGTVSKSRALQMFADHFGSVPGARGSSRDVAGSQDATFAMRAVIAHWDALSAKKRAAVTRRLSTPLNSLPKSKLTASTAGEESAARPKPGRPEVTFRFDKNVARYVAFFEKKLHFTLPSRIIVLDSSLKDLTGKSGEAAWMNATPANRRGDFQKTDAPYCLIKVRPSTPASDPTMAHEVFHCFEFALSDNWRGGDGWIWEGLAEWAMSFFTSSPRALWSYAEYLTDNPQPLFAKPYAAVGFWSLLQQQRGEAHVWDRVRSLLDAPSDAVGFQRSGADVAGFLEVWPSAATRYKELQDAWVQRRPLWLSPDDYPVLKEFIGSSGPLQAAPYTRHLGVSVADADLPVLHLTRASGHLRTGSGQRDFGSTSNAWYCLIEHCPCPADATLVGPDPRELRGKPLFMGLTGGSKAGRADLDYMSLKKWQKIACETPEPGIMTGTITYDWKHTTDYSFSHATATEHVVLHLRMSYDSYDGDGFVGLVDAGSTVTATFASEELSDPPGCEWSRGTGTGSFTGPAIAGFSGWKDDKGRIVAPGTTLTLPVHTSSTVITGVPGNCYTLSDSGTYERSMGIPDGFPVGVLAGRTVTYNYSNTDSGGSTTNKHTIKGSLNFAG